MDYIKQTFTFRVEDIWKISRLRSAHIANHIKSAEGITQESSLALTDSDRDLWNISLRYPAAKVYSYLMSAGKVAENGFQYDISDTSGAKVIIYTLYINPDWDKNLMRELNDMMEKALVSGGLADWFKSSLSAEAYQITKQEYEEALAECKANINKRKHRVNRPHTTF